MRASISGAAVIAVVMASIAACGADDPDRAASPATDAGADAPMIDADGAAPDGAPDGSAAGLPIKGTRLAPVFLESGDGYGEYIGIHDVTLDADCTVEPAEDGKLRCLPTSESAMLERFADATCTKELLVRSTTACETAKHARKSLDGAPSGPRTRIYAIGAVHTGAVFSKDGGTCVALAAPDPDSTVHELTPLPAADFVEMTREVHVVGGGVGENAFSGADGSRFPDVLAVDLARNEPCEPGFDVDGAPRCLPSPPGYIGGFTDAACTTPAFHCGSAGQCGTAATETADGGACSERRRRVRALGAKVPASAYHEPGVGGACEPGGPLPSGEELYEVGAEIAPAELPALGIAAPSGSRLDRRRFTAGGVPFASPRGIPRDVLLDVPCFIVRAADGVLRCLPMGHLSSHFSDDACTVRVAVDHRTCEIDRAHALVLDNPGECAPRWRVFEAAGSLGKGVPVWRKDGSGKCTSVATGADTDVFSVGAEVPASTFVELARVVR